MSALWAPVSEWEDETLPVRRSPSGLRAVRRSARALPTTRMARFPFLLVLIGLFGAGMAGLLMLNTTLQNQAFEGRTLTRQATELAYAQADLENQLDILGTPQELARRASAIGMRPNPHPALLVVPKGTVLGKSTVVTGKEVPSMVVKTPYELEVERAAALVKQKAAADKKAAKAKAAQQKAAAKKAAAQQTAERKAAAQQAAERERQAQREVGEDANG